MRQKELLAMEKLAFLCVLAAVCVPNSSTAQDVPWETGDLQPRWAGEMPSRVIRFAYESNRSAIENGRLLADALGKLSPGDMLTIASGRYSLSPKVSLNLRGTSEKPIWIVGEKSNVPVVITRPDNKQNVLNLGESSRTEFICLRNLEFTGGSTLIRFHDCHHIWLDRCHLHHAGAEGITTNTRDTSYFFITGNHFHDFNESAATGEAMYLGANQGKAVMSYSVIAHNHVHHCSGQQGDGIELKQGSHHNWIFRNHVHDTQYPCILVYGTNGKGLNKIERNLCYRSEDNVMQVQGEAIVENNVIVGSAGAGLASTDHQGKTSSLRVIHNTIIARSRGVNLSSWNGRSEMVLANNAIYTDGGEAIRFPNGSDRVQVAGNVILGRVVGVSRGYAFGADLSDFTEVSWDASNRDVRPSKDSALLGRGVFKYSVEHDYLGEKRFGNPSSGAVSSPSR